VYSRLPRVCSRTSTWLQDVCCGFLLGVMCLFLCMLWVSFECHVSLFMYVVGLNMGTRPTIYKKRHILKPKRPVSKHQKPKNTKKDTNVFRIMHETLFCVSIYEHMPSTSLYIICLFWCIIGLFLCIVGLFLYIMSLLCAS